MTRPRMNSIGCGRVGQTLGWLWQQAAAVHWGEVLNRSLASGEQAVATLQAGQAVAAVDAMQAADIWLLGCPDDQLSDCCEQLVAAQKLRPGDIVFHCSGALSSAVLLAVQQQGGWVASVHPVRSFASATTASQSFAGTYCALEGDAAAVSVLSALLTRIGGIPFAVSPEQKLIYHAASVMACNYLITLQDVSLRAFAQAGVDTALAMQLLQPLVTGTVSNVFAMGPAAALTGPIARGDVAVVGQQLQALTAWQPDVAELYRVLGQQTVQLARQRATADQDALDQLQAVFTSAKQCEA